MKNFILDMLYPRRCPVCHDIAVPKGKPVCSGCMGKLRPISGPRCMKCSKGLTHTEEEYCKDCRSKTHLYEKGIAVFSYHPIIRESLTKLKYQNRPEYAMFWGKYAALYAKDRIKKWEIDILVPVPLHRKRMEKRGYNQAQLIAESISKELHIPVDSKMVYRKKNTKPQKELDDKQRKKNLKEAFGVRQEKVRYQNVLVIDDIYTTGSTIDAMAYALKSAGVKNVCFLTVAVGSS